MIIEMTRLQAIIISRRAVLPINIKPMTHVPEIGVRKPDGETHVRYASDIPILLSC